MLVCGTGCPADLAAGQSSSGSGYQSNDFDHNLAVGSILAHCDMRLARPVEREGQSELQPEANGRRIGVPSSQHAALIKSSAG